METPRFTDDPLDVAAVRVLGSLVEKQSTTPDNYPLTLNALTAACNQTSNRDPVLHLEEADVLRALDDLARRKLARGVLRSDSRTTRYKHLLEETLSLHPPEIAVLGVLLLRGPQTIGEIRTRTARMFEFMDLAHVDRTLQSLMSLSAPLAAQLPRQPGQKEVRYAHLLAGEPHVEPQQFVAAEIPRTSRIEALEQEVASLRAEVAELRAHVEEFRRAFQ